MQVFPPCLLVLLSLLGLCCATFVGSPFEKAVYDVIQLRNGQADVALKRHTRSATGGVPCVSVRFLSDLQDRFRSWFDHNNDGLGDFEEIKNYIRRFKPNVKDETVAAFIRRRDSNGNGAIDFVPEYVYDLSAPDSSMEAAVEWFHLQDTNDDGSITEEELSRMASSMGMSPEAVRDTVKEYYMTHDTDNDGQLSFDEFKTLYNQKR